MNAKIASVLRDLDIQSKAEHEKEEKIPHQERMNAISENIGRFYNILLKATKATEILEIGTSVGYSTLWFAEAAISNTEKPKIITIENDENKIKRAQKNFENAGVNECIEICYGDALDILSKIKSHGKFDFIFIDADKERYKQYFDSSLRLLKKGGLIGADNILFPKRFNKMMKDYVNHVKNNPNVLSVTIPIDNGEELCIKLSD